VHHSKIGRQWQRWVIRGRRVQALRPWMSASPRKRPEVLRCRELAPMSRTKSPRASISIASSSAGGDARRDEPLQTDRGR